MSSNLIVNFECGPIISPSLFSTNQQPQPLCQIEDVLGKTKGPLYSAAKVPSKCRRKNPGARAVIMEGNLILFSRVSIFLPSKTEAQIYPMKFCLLGLLVQTETLHFAAQHCKRL